MYGWAAFGAAQEQMRAVEWSGAIVAAMAHGTFVIALSTVCAAYFPDLKFVRRMPLAFFGSAIVLLVGARHLAEFVAPLVEWLLLAIPTGWPAGAFLALESPTDVPAALYLAGVVAPIAAFPWAYRKLRRDYAIREVEFRGTFYSRAVALKEPVEPQAPDEATHGE
ncbi:MAG TPA: hypothetical protein VFW87_09835, partial [Pirellulales bacterium]|nr:hypothetical protein [Pirellulales bacterium]